MRILLSILLNAAILFFITYLLSASPEKGIEAGIIVAGGWKTYILGGIILGLFNVTVRPLLTLVSLPFMLFFHSIVTLLINGIILKLLDYIINNVLVIPGVSYHINGWVNFLIAVAIFSILNMFYSLLFSKR